MSFLITFCLSRPFRNHYRAIIVQYVYRRRRRNIVFNMYDPVEEETDRKQGSENLERCKQLLKIMGIDSLPVG